jgi:hypothetical protein
MHSLEIYSIRIHDRMMEGPIDDRYSILDDVRGYDLIDLLEESLVSVQDDFVDLREKALSISPGADLKRVPKRLYKCSDLLREGHVLSGCLNIGEYGSKNEIINRVSGDNIGTVFVDDSVVRMHYFHIEFRPGERQAIVFLQAIRGKGAKGIFEDAIKYHVAQKTGGLGCQVRPLAHKGLVNDWYENAVICEVRMSRFAVNDPVNDLADKLGDTYSEIKIKPKTRNARLGKLADLDEALIDIMKEKASVVKAQVEYNGRKRIFQLGVEDEPVSSVELDEESSDLEFDDGNPTLKTLRSFSETLCNEMWPKIQGI